LDRGNKHELAGPAHLGHQITPNTTINSLCLFGVFGDGGGLIRFRCGFLDTNFAKPDKRRGAENAKGKEVLDTDFTNFHTLPI
jgi:hypothetical protein